MKMRKASVLLVLAVAGCGGGGTSAGRSGAVAPVTSNTPPTPTGTAPTTTQSTVGQPVSATLTANEFVAFRELASVADFQIPGGAVLKDKAFALEDKGFVRILDLSGAKPALDREVQLDAAGAFAQGTAAGTITISDDHTAIVAVSGQEALYVFDPSSAQAPSDVTRIDLSTMQVTFNTPQVNSVGQAAPSPMPISFTASAIVSSGKIFIASSNLDASFNLNPGTVLAFDWNATTRAISNGSLIVTSAFDPTRLTRWRSPAGDELLLCVNAGVSGKGPSSVDVIDPKAAAIVATIPLGAVNAAGAVAITPDGKRGYVGSMSAAEVYELDLDQLVTASGAVAARFKGAIAVPGTTNGINFIAGVAVSSSGSYVYATNFNLSALAVIDVAARKVVGTLSGFQRQGNPTKFECNASAIAVRAGVPGVDFTGPAAFVVTVSLDAKDQTVPSVNVALDGVGFDRN